VFNEICYLSIAGIGSEGMGNSAPLNPGNGQYRIFEHRLNIQEIKARSNEKTTFFNRVL